MIIREMTFDDIAEVAELERQYSQTPWDATGIFSWWMRDDTLFLVAGEKLPEADQEKNSGKSPETAFAGEENTETIVRDGETFSESAGESGDAKENNSGKSPETAFASEENTETIESGSESAGAEGEDDEKEYVPPVVYGYVGLVMVPYESDITNITVSGECRRRGVGTALMEELFRRCPERGVTVIHLEVRESTAPARALYEKLGFIADGRRKNYYTDPAEDAILMTKNL